MNRSIILFSEQGRLLTDLVALRAHGVPFIFYYRYENFPSGVIISSRHLVAKLIQNDPRRCLQTLCVRDRDVELIRLIIHSTVTDITAQRSPVEF